MQPPRRRRAPPSPAYEEVRRELLQPWRIDVGDHDGIAADVHERCEIGDPFRPLSGLLLAHRSGYLVLPRERPGCGVAGLLPNVLLVRKSSDDRRWNLRALHELAEAILDRPRYRHSHTHADAWVLTLALAVPRAAFRRHDEAHHVPRWAVKLREITARVPARAA